MPANRMLVTALLLASLPAALPAAAAPALPAYREIRDWIVACDNTAECEAVGAQEEGNGDILFRLRSQPGPDGGLFFSIESALPIRMETMRLDGKPVLVDLTQWEHRSEDGNTGVSSSDAVAIRELLTAIRNGNRLGFNSGDKETSGSLSGLSAALLLIDEAQGRLDTATALLRRDRHAADRVPAPRPPAELRPAAAAPRPLNAAEQKRLIAAVRESQAGVLAGQECAVEAEDSHDQATPLTATEALVFIDCWHGAYQFSSLLFRVPMAAPERAQLVSLTLPLRIQDRERVIDAFTNADYAPEHGLLFHSAKGRGLADCGESAAWVFDGRQFQLSDYHYLGSCRGGNPGEWLRLWRSNRSP